MYKRQYGRSIALQKREVDTIFMDGWRTLVKVTSYRIRSVLVLLSIGIICELKLEHKMYKIVIKPTMTYGA